MTLPTAPRQSRTRVRGSVLRNYLCPHCLTRPEVIRVAVTDRGNVFTSYACEPCQSACEMALLLEGRRIRPSELRLVA